MSTAVAGVQRSPHRMIAHPARYFDRLPCDTDASCAAYDRARPRAGGTEGEGVIRVLRTLRDMYVSARSALFV